MDRTRTASVGHRPYAKDPDAPPSVTQLIGLLAIPALPWAAAKATAEEAYDTENWRAMDREQAVAHLAKAHRARWDGRAAIGTAVHLAAQHLLDGDTATASELLSELRETDNKVRTWLAHAEDPVAVVEPYVSGVQNWWFDAEPQNAVTEDVVEYPGYYIGQRDLVADVGEDRVLVDFKTSARRHTPYTLQWTLQLAAYRFATHVVQYELRGGKPVRVGTAPNEPVDRTWVVLFPGDRGYETFALDASRIAHDAVCHLAEIHSAVAAIERRSK